MKRLLFCISLLIGLCFCSFSQSISNTINLNYKKINAETAKESLTPIRAGIPGKVPFWNNYSKRFVYAPAFDAPAVDGASRYKFIVTASDSIKYTFTATKSNSSLAPVWAKIPVGSVNLKIVALDASGKEIKESFNRKFHKSPVFHGPYQNPATDYRESAKKALTYIFNKPFIQSWADKAAPDTASYHLYCYPAKIISAVTEMMMNYSKLSQENHDKAMKIAVNTADYLISISEPKDAPLAYFPPTYAGEGNEVDNSPRKYRNQFMLIYPAQSACIYLDLYDVTKIMRYKEAAIRIADTYQKLQNPSGTWKLRLWKNGTAVTNVDCIPTVIIQFFDRLSKQYGINDYKAAREKAYQWMWSNPMKTFNWSGQFEDQNPLVPYKDLTKDDAACFAMALFGQLKSNPSFKQTADELLRYSEDQFVIWGKINDTWPTPSALEQYDCYTPINASASVMIDAYMSAYRATKNELYLAKAIALVNSVTTTQIADSGRYPTFWSTDRKQKDPDKVDWLNCTSYTVKMMLAMDDLLKGMAK